MSSSWREINAIHLAMTAYAKVIRADRVKWYADHTNVVHIMKKGCMKSNVNDLTLNIYKLCLQEAISTDIEWVLWYLSTKAATRNVSIQWTRRTQYIYIVIEMRVQISE